VKIGIVGKGGVGKTTIAALVARTYAARGRRVVAVDTDSSPNLGLSLGLDLARTESIPVLPRSLVVGAGGDCTVDEVLEEYGTSTPFGVTVLSALRVTEAAAGCTCGGHRTVRSLLAEVLDRHADVTLVDMEAGIEHLSRSGGTLAYADVLVIVMEPTRKAVVTGARTVALAGELGIRSCVGVGNKLDGPADAAALQGLCAEYGVRLVGSVPKHAAVMAADVAGEALVDGDAPEVWAAVAGLVDAIDAEVAGVRA
jgi:CO dehydrogenase maturation factor